MRGESLESRESTGRPKSLGGSCKINAGAPLSALSWIGSQGSGGSRAQRAAMCAAPWPHTAGECVCVCVCANTCALVCVHVCAQSLFGDQGGYVQTCKGPEPLFCVSHSKAPVGWVTHPFAEILRAGGEWGTWR